MKYDSMQFDDPWRTNFELRAAVVWVVSTLLCIPIALNSAMPTAPFYFMFAICSLMALIRVPQAYKIYRLKRSAKGKGLEFIEFTKLNQILSKKPNMLWFGRGFVWENRHTQRVHEIIKRDVSSVVKNNLNTVGAKRGQQWIHGVEVKEDNIFQHENHSSGQNLIVGTTGAGKTRFYELLVTQFIARGETVIIVDPKGDQELLETARKACTAAGKAEKFAYFHPAFPKESVRIDTLKNATRVTQLASRISALIPSETGADPFKSFGWQAINNICQALVLTEVRPSLVKIKTLLESGTESIIYDAIVGYVRKFIPKGEQLLNNYMRVDANSLTGRKRTSAIIKFYQDVIRPIKGSPELEGVLSMYAHDSAHFGKMVANLLPIMNMLTAGDMADLLSPDYEDIDNESPITDSKKIIDNKMVFYIGLDSLTDDMVGSAIGSIILADLVAVAGDRYNYEPDKHTVNILVDEASEVLNQPVVQLANKGRGAGIKLFLATQTVPDIAVRLGSKDKAMQLLGNLNNIYALRCIDPETQEFIANQFPETRIKTLTRTQGVNTKDVTLLHGASVGESLREEKVPTIPPQLFGMLPDLEFIAKTSGGSIIKGKIPIIQHPKAVPAQPASHSAA